MVGDELDSICNVIWICPECGRENSYNDEVQSTECPDCGTIASKKEIKRVRKELDNYRKECRRFKILLDLMNCGVIWICPNCSQENSYNDEIQSAECSCCGAILSQREIRRVRKELKRCHKNAGWLKVLEKIQHRREIVEQRVIKISSTIKKAVKVITVVIYVLILSSLVMIALNFGNSSFSSIASTIQDNVSELAVVSLPQQIVEYVEYEKDTVNEYLEQASFNVKSQILDASDLYSENIAYLNDSEEESLALTASNSGLVFSSGYSQVRQIAGNISLPLRDISQTVDNYAWNLSALKERISKNVQNLTDLFSG